MAEKTNSGNDSFIKSNVISLLQSFSRDEMKEFGKFVSSPFFNDRGNVTEFYKILKEFYPEFKHKDFSKEKVYRVLYPNEKYKDDVIRRLSSNLFKLGEEYAAYKTFRKDTFEYEKYLLEFYLSRFKDNFFIKQKKILRVCWKNKANETQNIF